MDTSKLAFALAATLPLTLGMFTGRETTDGRNTHLTSNNYYGTRFNDPRYYGDDDDDQNVIVAPPRPGNPPPPHRPPNQGLHPAHPIARPPDASSCPPAASQMPAPQPMPSISSAPRPEGRR